MPEPPPLTSGSTLSAHGQHAAAWFRDGVLQVAATGGFFGLMPARTRNPIYS